MARIIGTKRGDELLGTHDDDLILGRLGNDVINGSFGNDTINGMWGDDYIDGHNGDDTIYGGRGDDVLGGGPGWDFLSGGPGNDQLYGGENGYLRGGDGDDFLVAFFGSLSGDAGNDTLDARIGGIVATASVHGGVGVDLFRIDCSIVDGSDPFPTPGSGYVWVDDFQSGVDKLDIDGYLAQPGGGWASPNWFDALDSNDNQILDDGDDAVTALVDHTSTSGLFVNFFEDQIWFHGADVIAATDFVT